MNIKLELKHLIGYLPYNLQVKSFGIFEEDIIFTMSINDRDGNKFKATVDWILETDRGVFKPILYPLKNFYQNPEKWEDLRDEFSDYDWEVFENAFFVL